MSDPDASKLVHHLYHDLTVHLDNIYYQAHQQKEKQTMKKSK